MGEVPQSCRIMINPNGCGLSHKDFIPDCIEEGGIFNKPTYESFRSLIGYANEWLRHNIQSEVKTCESIELAANRDTIEPSRMHYVENAKYETWYIRGLRLWLKPFPPGKERVQKIGYMNLKPEIKSSGGLLKEDEYETLDEILFKFNDGSRAPGRIITIETQGMKIKEGIVDPDRTRWTEKGGKATTKYLFIIRIFYEVCDALYEEIGFTDFTPEIESTGCIDICAKYEDFSKLVEKASDWCAVQSNLRVCNVQSVYMHYQNGIDTKKMNYKESGRCRTVFVRVLRIAHTRRQTEDTILPIRLTCKSFIPVVLKSAEVLSPQCREGTPEPKFETIEETMRKVSKWIQVVTMDTYAEVVSVETSAVPVFYRGVEYSSERTLSSDPLDGYEIFMYIIRVYLSGSFTEPFADDSKKIPVISFRPYKAIAFIIGIILFVEFVFWVPSPFSPAKTK